MKVDEHGGVLRRRLGGDELTRRIALNARAIVEATVLALLHIALDARLLHGPLQIGVAAHLADGGANEQLEADKRAGRIAR